MRYYERDNNGAIVASYARPQPGKNLERLAGDHPDVVAWRARPEPKSSGPFDRLLEKLEAKGVLTREEVTAILGE